uniref:Ig-like domain-containing protein n=1 Tax=Nothobranchius kadleci TaxID=1051664 RepID=A0A1A8DYR2_NOTKA
MTEWILFLQVFVGLVLFMAGEPTSCPIELSPIKAVVKHGDPGSVNCSTSDGTSKELGWEASQGGTRKSNATDLPWEVVSVTNWGMKPICYITNTDCQKTVDLVIYTFPESISFRSNESNDEMTEHKAHTFICDIFNIAPVQNLTVQWYKDDAVIHTAILNDETMEPTNQSPAFTFIPTRADRHVRFRCEARMDLGPEGPLFHASSAEYLTDVLFGPDIPCSTITLREGEPLKEQCKVTGNPSPYVEWLKNGHPINTSVPLRRNDTGTYTVKAEGHVLSEKQIQVNVFYGPEWTCPHVYNITENSHHDLTCSQGFPKPEEIWYKDGEEVELPQVLTRRHAGQYVVMVSTRIFSIHINVLYPPSEIFELEDSEVQIGTSLGLKCSSAGSPRPNYSWIYYQATNVMEETEDGVSRLMIHDATGNNMGLYTCHAWNEHGYVSKTVTVTVQGAKLECPIKITPDTMVLQYQSRGQSVDCKSTTNETNVKEIFWTTQQGDTLRSSAWFADTHKDWDPRPVCHGEFRGIGNCSKALHYILYKSPESVLIGVVDERSPALVGTVLQLQCDIVSVAPAQDLNVRWMFKRGNETIRPESVGVSNATGCSFSPYRSPVNVSCIMNITLQKIHNDIQVQCVAELNLGPTLPQPPSLTSSPLRITVLYEPRINATKLPETVPVFRGYPEVLVCEADGNPRPVIQWEYSSQTAHVESEGKLNVSDAGVYICRASNDLNSTERVVEVILLEDYLPLIAGIVALTVVIISIIFIFIYSIYYKNTKMRHYSLKNPKFSNQNGNVAHNGWDIQLPVTRLP